MKKYLFGLLLALTSLASFAGPTKDRVLKIGDNSATLLVESCKLDFLSDEVRGRAKAARLVLDGKVYVACYIEENEVVMLIDEDQDVYGPFPVHMFTPAQNT